MVNKQYVSKPSFEPIMPQFTDVYMLHAASRGQGHTKNFLFYILQPQVMDIICVEIIFHKYNIDRI